MQLTRLCIFIAFIIQILFLPAAQGYDLDRNLCLVKLKISSSDEILRTELVSVLNRELRLIKDISVVDEGKIDWIIQVVVMEIINKQGVVTGYVCSVVFLNQFYSDGFIPYIKREPQFPFTDPLKYYQMMTKDLSRLKSHFLFTGSRQDIQDAGRYIASKFDVDILEEARKIDRVMLPGIRKDEKGK